MLYSMQELKANSHNQFLIANSLSILIMKLLSRHQRHLTEQIPLTQKPLSRKVKLPTNSAPKRDMKLISRTTPLDPIFQGMPRNPESDTRSSSSTKTNFRSRQIKSIGKNKTITPSIEMKLAAKENDKRITDNDLKVVKFEETGLKKPSEEVRKVLPDVSKVDIMHNIIKRKELHGLNYFEKPKISGLAKAKIMRLMGCEQEANWADYWINLEKKISAIEKKEETFQPSQSTSSLFNTEH